MEEIKNPNFEKYLREDCQTKLEVPDQAESPGQGNSPHILGENPKEDDHGSKEGEAREEVIRLSLEMRGQEECREEGNGLAGLLEGRGTYVGTPTPPEPKPEVLLEGQGTSLGTLIPQGEGKEAREVEKEGEKEKVVVGETKEQMDGWKKLMATRDLTKKVDKKEKRTPKREKKPPGKKTVKKDDEVDLVKMRSMLKNWTKQKCSTDMTVETPRDSSKVEVDDVEQAGQGVGDGGIMDKEKGRMGIVGQRRKKFSGTVQKDGFQEWKEGRSKRKLEDLEEDSAARKGRKTSDNCGSIGDSSENLKTKINHITLSKFRGGDHWTPGGQAQEGGEGAVGGVGGVQARENMQQRARREGVLKISNEHSNAAAGRGRLAGENRFRRGNTVQNSARKNNL